MQLAAIGALLLMLACAGGCAPYSRDVSHSEQYAGGYRAGRKYEILKEVALIRGADDHWRAGTRFYLTHSEAAHSIEANRPGDKLIGIVAPGTAITLTKVIAVTENPKPLYLVDLVRPVGTIMDGQYAGTHVDCAEISAHRF